ncbi:MAG: cob(I)yrinic acid a,c-diamide adenosyltransferase [Spirochaetes bacterium]|nr:cob(I)yrinic acid a,c-diamide adenosyltransferase [Spirochaetota bacterium]
MDRGLVHIYTGNGKGKTTAALGLCFRAAGYGYRCAFLQFLKGRETGEMFSCAKTDPAIIFEQYGTGDFLFDHTGQNTTRHKSSAEKGIDRAFEIVACAKFDIVVLDEIITLPSLQICSLDRVIQLMQTERGRTELVLTGRGAGEELIRHADLVTEMKEIKHYFNSGVPARRGIEY